MQAQSDRLHVFISSRMHEFQDLRPVVHERLQELGINAFVYEVDLDAHPDDPETVSLLEVERTDLLALIIGDSYGEITEREYDHARELGKPCLIYERQGRTSTDRDLERFLKKLSGPRGVPSRTKFNTAVDLAEKLAKDVQAWLVREYRRLSASEKTVDEHSRRKSEIGASIQRLTASTDQPLPTGNSADLLAWQLQQWFEALEYPINSEPHVGQGYCDLIISVPARRRRFDSVLVRAKDGEIQGHDVEDARASAQEQKLDEVWLVSFRRISPAARQAAEAFDDVLLYTLDELIEEDVDFERYFDWLDKQVQKAEIDRYYVPLAVTINEVDPSGTLRAESSHDNVSHYVDQWLEDNDGEHLSLLGEFGTGKSWFALKYAHDKVQEYRKAQEQGKQRPRVALVVRLREYARGFKDVGALLTEFVFREHQINIRSFAVLEALNRMGRLLFIFDGFDEMAARVDQQKMVDNFWSLASVLGPGSKAILTCRTEYFQFAKQAREVLSGKLRSSSMKEVFETTRFQVATLQMFDEPRLRTVLGYRSDDEALIESVVANKRLFDLGRRPVMVDLLIEAMPGLEAENADLSQVYYQAVCRKMERDISLGRTFTSMADKIFFMCEIAWEMLSNRQLKVHYKQIPDRIRDYFGSRVSSVEEDHWRHDLLSQTMLVRDDEGYYRPAHKSLIEFFSAYKLAAEIGALGDYYLTAAHGYETIDYRHTLISCRWSEYFAQIVPIRQRMQVLESFEQERSEQLTKTWAQLSVDAATSEMIIALCGQEALINSLQKLTSSENQNGQVSAKVLEVAAFGGALSNVRVSGLIVDGCRLQDCTIRDADFSSAGWFNCHFDKVLLDRVFFRDSLVSHSRFSNTTMREVDFSNCSFEGDDLFQVVVLGAVWCVLDQVETLIVLLSDARVVAIVPNGVGAQRSCIVNDLEAHQLPTEVIDWIRGLQEEQDPPSIQSMSFGQLGWQLGVPWQRETMDKGLKCLLSTNWTGPGGDVEVLTITVVDATTSTELFDRKIYDATDLYSSNKKPGTRIIAIGHNGKKAAVVHGVENGEESASLLGQDQTVDIPLDSFIGSRFIRGPETIDKRGAAFSSDDAIVAICERTHSIGFWQTEDGKFLGRIEFYPSLTNCQIDGAEGLPPELIEASKENEGWLFEAPDQKQHDSEGENTE